MKTILVATEKAFGGKAIEEIKNIIRQNPIYKLELLENYKSKEELIKKVKNCDALIIRSDKLTKTVLDNAEKLKIVVRAGAGYDNIDTQYARQKGIVAMNTPGQNANAVAELVMGLLVYCARNKFNGKNGTELKGKRIGIHALGNIGKRVVSIAKGFGMEVFAYDVMPIKNAEVKIVNTVEELYAKSDYITLHIPATSQTKKSINYNLLRQMRPNATLINTARKEVIDEEGLLRIMEERDDIAYISDITPDNENVFQQKYSDRCFFTPKKMGAQTTEANINAGIAAVKQIINFLENDDDTFRVN